jgi:hypothetical protein
MKYVLYLVLFTQFSMTVLLHVVSGFGIVGCAVGLKICKGKME